MTSKHTCKLCWRHFSSGRALGGHMRSHAKPYIIAAAAVGSAALPSSSSSATHGGDRRPKQPVSGDGLQEKRKRSWRLTDPELSSAVLGAAAASSSVVLPDWESDTESSKPPPPQKPGELEPEPASSVSDTTPEEDVALCLVMLSRDAWCSVAAVAAAAAAAGVVEEVEMAESKPAPRVRSRTGGGRRKHSCRTCGKVFRSHQALGGHRASHKQPRSCAAAPPPPPPYPTGISGEEDTSPAIIHECSVASVGGAPAAPAWRITIDLNMPPPMD